NRFPHAGQWRRRRISVPSSASRESTTLESGLRQYGQRIAGLPTPRYSQLTPMWLLDVGVEPMPPATGPQATTRPDRGVSRATSGSRPRPGNPHGAATGRTLARPGDDQEGADRVPDREAGQVADREARDPGPGRSRTTLMITEAGAGVLVRGGW